MFQRPTRLNEASLERNQTAIPPKSNWATLGTHPTRQDPPWQVPPSMDTPWSRLSSQHPCHPDHFGFSSPLPEFLSLLFDELTKAAAIHTNKPERTNPRITEIGTGYGLGGGSVTT